MISLLITLPLLLGWMTDEMLYQQQQQQALQNSAGAAQSPPEEEAVDHGLSDDKGTVKTNEANGQAIYWLSLLDQMQYSPSWLAAGPLLKDTVTQSQWEAAMKATRGTYGNVRSRKLGSTQTVQQLPNGTKGKFTVLTYQTQFNGGNHTEIVTLMSTPPSTQWKVISYQLQK